MIFYSIFSFFFHFPLTPGGESLLIQSHGDLWRIEARSFRIRYTPFAHNFWLLTAPDGAPAGQIHGLAVDPATGQAQAVGNSRCLLQAVHAADFVWSLQLHQPCAVAAVGSKQTIFRRWQAALAAIPALNALALPYPNVWQHGYKPNSNSIFTTIGQILGFARPQQLLPAWAPGASITIAPEIVAKFRYEEITPKHRL